MAEAHGRVNAAVTPQSFPPLQAQSARQPIDRASTLDVLARGVCRPSAATSDRDLAHECPGAAGAAAAARVGVAEPLDLVANSSSRRRHHVGYLCDCAVKPLDLYRMLAAELSLLRPALNP